MHLSSMNNMLRCIQRYLDPRPPPGRKLVVVDIGATNVNGSYREHFDPDRFDYVGIDLAPGPGVDLVIADPYRTPLADGAADVVISGQMLEHNEFFWLTFQEKVRILHPDGFIFMIAPSRGQIHRYPVDCYRFYPDAYAALAKYTNTVLVDCWLDDNHWGDLVGVFRKTYTRQYGKFDTARLTTWQPAAETLAAADAAAAPPPWNGKPGTPEEERLGGTLPYPQVLQRLHDELRPGLYLEIGVRTGASLALARGDAIGVDPAPILSVDLPPTTRMVQLPSDEFFAGFAPDRPVDLGFIDGLHVFEQALRDFIHMERCAARDGVIVIDDIFPNHAHQARRQRGTRAWTGDIWKLHHVLQRLRPELTLLALDTHPTGLLVVTGLDPDSTVLAEAYDRLVRQYAHEMAPPPEVLARVGSVPPAGLVFDAVLSRLSQRRRGLADGAP